MNIKSLSPGDRPRERLLHNGPKGLSDAELLALVLKSGTQKENILQLCQHLLAKYNLESLSRCTVQELTAEHGIGEAKACQLVAVFELHHRIGNGTTAKINIQKAEDIAHHYLSRLSSLQKEHLVAVYLDTKHNIIADETITIGILNASLIHPREVFHGALKHLAHSIIVVHNHPSGDPAPSDEDIKITKQLYKTGEIMGIPLLDHVILGKDSWWSWREHT